jgi:peptidoglycan/LPS O-acetylase OafA/YrhL
MVDLSRSESVVGAFLASKLLVLLGGASYALYLLQGPIRAACDALIPHPFDRFINPLLVFPGAIVVFLYWEQPARRMLNTWYQFAHRGISREAA